MWHFMQMVFFRDNCMECRIVFLGEKKEKKIFQKSSAENFTQPWFNGLDTQDKFLEPPPPIPPHPVL